ncbi:hypothetical protein [Sphingomonas desiccabilis]|uniref:Uncharacterized protein n=1 Tax=Sphingomonas desiccabilis TaxID=429134 RepID=A0A4Q2ITU3_9SPHN|nr:hypothetical protein [Sphingomonas desiccabilis]MBB3911658.1 hypothetical protein [Sphingomonas desiccabilis]RXZ31609.1 hypothetical protein EO081_10255 [Sphingomonas desiccabilis]
MIALAFLLGQAPPTLTLLQVRELSPAAAGDAILGDEQHGPIERFEAPTGGMNVPGLIEGQLVERPVPSALGCVRRRWTVKFRAAPGADISTAKVQSGTYSTREISPSSDGICPAGDYVRLSPGVSVEQGWDALAKLKEIRTGVSATRFECSDTTSSGLCDDSKAIRVALRTLTPWAITRDDDDVLIWLGVRGGIVTEVRFNSAQPSRVLVTRKVPAPF